MNKIRDTPPYVCGGKMSILHYFWYNISRDQAGTSTVFSSRFKVEEIGRRRRTTTTDNSFARTLMSRALLLCI